MDLSLVVFIDFYLESMYFVTVVSDYVPLWPSEELWRANEVGGLETCPRRL